MFLGADTTLEDKQLATGTEFEGVYKHLSPDQGARSIKAMISKTNLAFKRSYDEEEASQLAILSCTSPKVPVTSTSPSTLEVNQPTHFELSLCASIAASSKSMLPPSLPHIGRTSQHFPLAFFRISGLKKTMQGYSGFLRVVCSHYGKLSAAIMMSH